MMIKERQSYDREFKQKAVELSFARGNTKEYCLEHEYENFIPLTDKLYY